MIACRFALISSFFAQELDNVSVAVVLCMDALHEARQGEARQSGGHNCNLRQIGQVGVAVSVLIVQQFFQQVLCELLVISDQFITGGRRCRREG